MAPTATVATGANSPAPDGFVPRPDFKIFTRGVEVLKTNADGDEDGKRRIRCIASSNVKDLHGDTMTAHCVRSMAKQAEGLTIFLNHSYRAPDDIFGVVEKARTKKVDAAAAKAKGWIDQWAPDEPVVLLELDVMLSSGSRIDDTFTHMENGVRLGVSIGANISEWEEEPGHEDSWWPPLIINNVDLLEASIVGIPANPLSWVEGATKSLIRRGLVKGATEETFQQARRAMREAAEEGKPMPKPTDKTADTAPEETPAAEAENDTEKAAPEPFMGTADGPEDIVAHYQSQVEAGLRSKTDLDALEDDVQKSIDFALQNGLTEEAFEGRTAADLAKEILANIPADEAEEESAEKSADAPGEDEEAQESSPDSDDEGSSDEEQDDAAEAERAVEAEMTSLTEKGALEGESEMVGVIRDLLRKNAVLSVHNGRLVSEKAALIEERDEAKFNANEAIKLVREIMELPLARKSTPIQREVATGADRLKGKLSAELLSILYPPEERA